MISTSPIRSSYQPKAVADPAIAIPALQAHHATRPAGRPAAVAERGNFASPDAVLAKWLRTEGSQSGIVSASVNGGGRLTEFSGMTTATYRIIRHADSRIFYDGDPITLAEAQVMINEAIAGGTLEVNSFLRIDEDLLVIELDAVP